ncbi:MAG: DPP IV N-terminal domain-containing protein [Cyclobacteriaceae bacterium]
MMKQFYPKVCFALLLSGLVSCSPGETAQEAWITPTHWDYQASWSPDGERLVFASTRNSHPTLNIFTMNKDGEDLKQLTFSKTGWGNSFPTYSPDQKQISFITDRDGNKELYLMNTNGSSLTNLTEHPADEGDYSTFSADGSKIFFERSEDGNSDIYVLHLADRSQERLTVHPWKDRAPTLSPDGKFMAFETSRFNGNSEIALMDLSNRSIEQLTDSWSDDGGASFSPDGKSIYFYSNQNDIKYDIHRINLETKQTELVTHSPNWDLDARVSPNGKALAFQSSRNGRWGIVITDIEGNNRRRITNKLANPFKTMVIKEGLAATLSNYPKWALDSLQKKYHFEEELIALAYDLIEVGRSKEAVEVIDYAHGLGISAQIGSVRASVYSKIGLEAPMDQAGFFQYVLDNGTTNAKEKYTLDKQRFPEWNYFSEWEMNMIGYYHHSKEKYQSAIDLFQLCLEEFPTSAMAHHDMGNSYKELGLIEEAVEYHKRTVELDSGWYGQDSQQILQSLLNESN